jgi:hypothetical protein
MYRRPSEIPASLQRVLSLYANFSNFAMPPWDVSYPYPSRGKPVATWSPPRGITRLAYALRHVSELPRGSAPVGAPGPCPPGG